MFTIEEFERCMNIQSQELCRRGTTIPKEIRINPALKKQLKLGDTVVLDYVGEIKLTKDPSMPLFMFNGRTDKPFIAPVQSVPKSVQSVPKSVQSVPKSVLTQRKKSVR